jgi:hypothetical protein
LRHRLGDVQSIGVAMFHRETELQRANFPAVSASGEYDAERRHSDCQNRVVS